MINYSRCILGILAVCLAMPAYPQIALEEIVVTAQRREQSLQDVPVSVTAFTGARLEQANVNEAADYLALTPNVSFTEGFSVGSRGLGIGVRGVTNNVTDENSFVNSIGVYIDGFSVASVPTGVANPQLQDIERIEVLRGPQGTYFGRNAVGGALNLTTRKPTDEVGAKISVSGESFESAGEQFGVTTVLNVPVTERFGFRAVAYYEDSTGLVENVNPGGNNSGHDYFVGRLNFAYTLGDTTEVNFLIMHADEDQGTDENVPSGVWDIDTVSSFGLGCNGAATGCNNNSTSPLTAPVDANIINGAPIGNWQTGNYNKTSRDLDEHNKNTTTLGVLNIAHELADGFVVKSVTGIIGATNSRLFDNDLLGGSTGLLRENEIDATSWSTELRTEISAERYDLIIGGLYADDIINRIDGVQATGPVFGPLTGTGMNRAPAFVIGLPGRVGAPPICLACVTKIYQTEGFAIFSDFTWRATEALDLTFGFRYTDETVTQTRSNRRVTTNAGDLRPSGVAERDFSDFAPRFVAQYQITDDVGVYANISKGYKAGGTALNNAGGNSDPALDRRLLSSPYEKETLWNYEVGFKSEWLDNRLRVNAAGFYLDWNNLQLESFRFLTPGDLTSNAEFVINVEDARAYGFEVETLAAISDRLSFSAAVGYLDAEITSDQTVQIKASFPVDLKGVTLPRSPEWTATVSAEYRQPVGLGEAWFRADYIYRDSQTTDIEGATYTQTSGRVTPAGTGFVPANPSGFPYVAPSYNVVNLRAGYEYSEGLSVTLFIENLFEEDYYTGTQEDFGLSGFRLRPHPRIYGANVSYSFGGI